MHYQHHQPAGDGLDASQILAVVQARVRRATVATLWLRRATELIGELRSQNANLREEVVMWRSLAAKRAGLADAPPPPDEFIAALRTPQHEPFRTVIVLIDGQPWTVGLRRDRPMGADPVRELTHWAQLVATARAVRAELAGEA